MDNAAKKQSQKLEALGLFAGGIAHDFNNILSVIDAYARLALKEQAAPEEMQKILAAAERGAGLTRRLLAFSRQKVGVAEALDVAEELRQAAALLPPLLGENIRLELALPASPVYVLAGHDDITQIALNLALNARDAMLQGGRLVISRRSAQGRARISFHDTGAGIAPDALPHIFDPFFTTKPAGQGTGLGLSVVHGVVSQLGGEISARNEKGARFDISFPLVPAPEKTASGASLAGRTLLLAEDENELRDVLALSIRGMEMEVLTAANGNQALELQQNHGGPIDFLLADVVMPGMGGEELGERFKAARPSSNVVYMSAYPLAGAPEEGDYIAKPFSPARLEAILKRALERRDARLKGEIGPSDGDDFR